MNNIIRNLWLESERLWQQSSKENTIDCRFRDQIHSAWLGANFVTISDALPKDLIVKAFEWGYFDKELALLLLLHKNDLEDRESGINLLIDLIIKQNGPEDVLDYLDHIQITNYREGIIDSVCQEFTRKHNFIIAKQIISSYFGKGYKSFRLLNNCFKVLLEEEQAKELYELMDEAILVAEAETLTTAIDLLTSLYENLKTENLRSDFYTYLLRLEKSSKLPAVRPIELAKFGDYKRALFEASKMQVKNNDAQDELAETISMTILSEAAVRDNDIFNLADESIQKVIDEEVRNELRFGLLMKKYIPGNWDLFIQKVSKLKHFYRQGEYFNQLLALLIEAKRYDFVIKNIEYVSNTKNRIAILCAVIDSQDTYNSITTDAYNAAQTIINHTNNILERLILSCRILSSLKQHHEIQIEQKKLESEFYGFILLIEKSSVHPDLSDGIAKLLKASFSNEHILDFAELAISLAKVGLLAEALITTDFLNDSYCEKSRTLCQICEILVGQDLFEKALRVANSIDDRRWKDYARHHIALRYLNVNNLSEALRLINQMESMEIKSVTLKDFVVALSKIGEMNESLKLFSQIVYQDDRITAMQSLIGSAMEVSTRELVLNKLIIEFIVPVITNLKDIKEIYSTRINHPTDLEVIKKEFLIKKEDMQRFAYDHIGFNYEIDHDLETRKSKLKILYEKLFIDPKKSLDPHIKTEKDITCLALFAYDMYTDGGSLLAQIENKDLLFSVLRTIPELVIPNNVKMGVIYTEKLISFLRKSDIRYFHEFLHEINLLEFCGGTALLEFVLKLAVNKNILSDIKA